MLAGNDSGALGPALTGQELAPRRNVSGNPIDKAGLQSQFRFFVQLDDGGRFLQRSKL